MAERQSLGPIQVGDNEVASINDALRQLQERIDAVKGLSGGATVHDSQTAEAFRVLDGDVLIHALGTTT